MLFDQVNKEHILQGIKDFEEKGLPNGFGPSSTYDLVFENKKYPPKAVMVYANYHAIGRKIERYFSGGIGTDCFKTFEINGFEIILKSKKTEIVNSFQPYYTNTMLTEETDPDKLYDLVYEIEQFNLYTKYQVDEFCKEFYRKSDSDEKLHPIIDVVVDKFKDSLDTEQQDEFKSMIQSYIRLYSYISQISSFTEIEWEKTYVFLRFLNKKLPKGISERLSIIDSVDLDSLRIQMIGESNLSLEDKGGELDPISSGVGGMIEDEKELLSEIIEKVNSVYGLELREEDKYYLENVDKKMTENVEMKKVMLGNNSEDVKREFYKDLFKDKMIDYTGDRMEFYKKVMDDRILPVLVDVMYNNYRKSIGNQNP